MADLYLSSVVLPDGTSYKLKDEWARDQISELSSYTKFLGVTTTVLTDGATTNPIVIAGDNVTAKSGDITSYGSKEFIFNGTAWQEFGDLSALKALAYKDNASGSYTPAGTIANTETKVTVNSITDVGTLPTKGADQTVVSDVGYTAGTLPTFTVSGEVLTFGAGTLPTVVPQTVTVNSITDVGTLPTKGTDTDVLSGVTSAFTGTAATITVS